MRLSRPSIFAVVGLAAFAMACSSKKTSGSPADGGAGDDDDAAAEAAAGDRVTDQGRVIDFDSKKPAVGVTVAEGDVSTTTDSKGAWSLRPLANTPMQLTFSAAKDVTLTYVDVSLSGDTTREDVDTLSIDTLHLVGGGLDGYDNTKGVLFIGITALPSCAAQTGATVTVTAPAGSTTRYVLHGIPQAVQKAVALGEDPAIAIYNLTPNTPVELTLTHPTCEVEGFPYTDGTLTYTGKISTSGGDATSYARFFLK